MLFDMQQYIEIENLQVQAFHGVLEQEHTVGNLYRIDCKLRVDMTQAMNTDQLDHTVSYADVVVLIEQEMQKPSQLLEHVAGRILKRLHAVYGQQVLEADLRIAKQCPPIAHATIGACAVHVVTDFSAADLN